MASTTNSGSISCSNDNGSHNYNFGWQITLTEGNIDYVNNQSRVYYTVGTKTLSSTYGWGAVRSNWFACGFDTDATYDDEYNYRYSSTGAGPQTSDWRDDYYWNKDHNRYIAIECRVAYKDNYTPLRAGTGSIDNFSATYTMNGGSNAYRTFTHAADGSGSAKLGIIWARRDASNWNGLVGQFKKNTITSNTLTLTNTRATVKIYNGSAWVNAIPYVYDGSAWKQAIPYVYNGSTWTQCTG